MTIEKSRLADYQSRKADSTLRRQRADLALFAEFLQSADIPDAPSGDALTNDPDAWRGITWGLVEAFRNWQLKRGYAIGSVNARFSTVRVYARLAAMEGAIDPDEIILMQLIDTAGKGENRAVRRIGRKKERAIILTPEQVRRLKRQPDNPQGRRDAVLVCLMVDHGLRVSEVAGLQVTDIDLESGHMTFYRQKVDLTQTHKLTRDTAAALRRYFKAGDAPALGPLMRASTGAHRLTHAGVGARNLSERIRYLGRLVGIDGLSAHDLRHTWATLAAISGTRLDRLMDAGGWKCIESAMQYIAPYQVANEGVVLE